MIDSPDYLFGRMIEGRLAAWFERAECSDFFGDGSTTLPSVIIELNKIEQGEANKGPRIRSIVGDEIAPDLQVCRAGRFFFVESKAHRRCTWYRTGKPPRWQTGMGTHYFESYLRSANNLRAPLWVLFYQQGSQPSLDDLKHHCPKRCPIGLFGDEIQNLRARFDHRFGGMLYWDVSRLKLIASIDEVNAAFCESRHMKSHFFDGAQQGVLAL
jgi:hypothetical protein